MPRSSQPISRRLHLWWQGKPYENEKDTDLVFLNHYDRHWTSRAVRAAVDYSRAYHQWIIGLAVAVLALAIKMK